MDPNVWSSEGRAAGAIASARTSTIGLMFQDAYMIRDWWFHLFLVAMFDYNLCHDLFARGNERFAQAQPRKGLILAIDLHLRVLVPNEAAIRWSGTPRHIGHLTFFWCRGYMRSASAAAWCTMYLWSSAHVNLAAYALYCISRIKAPCQAFTSFSAQSRLDMIICTSRDYCSCHVSVILSNDTVYRSKYSEKATEMKVA